MAELTVKDIEALPRKEHVGDGKVHLYMLNDLGVRVFPSGAKTFVYWYRDGTTEHKRMLTLGRYGDMTLKEANAALVEAKSSRNKGTDPAQAKRTERDRQRRAERGELVEPGEHTVRSAFAYWKEHGLRHKPRTGKRPRGRKDNGALLQLQFEKHILKALGEKPLKELKRGDIVRLIDKLMLTQERTASVMFASLRQMLNYCAARDFIDANPMAPLSKVETVGEATIRTRVLDDAELRAFVHKIGKMDLHVVTTLALRFVLATGQRPGEVAGMAKAELDKAGTLWTIPAARYKTGKMHHVPLSAYARGILAEAARYNAPSPYVFPSPTTDAKPLDRHSLSHALLRKHKAHAFGIAEAFTPHDLRRTCRTRMAAIGVRDYVAEKVLGHKLEGMLAVYDQHDYLDERREALELWGKTLSDVTKNLASASGSARQ